MLVLLGCEGVAALFPIINILPTMDSLSQHKVALWWTKTQVWAPKLCFGAARVATLIDGLEVLCKWLHYRLPKKGAQMLGLVIIWQVGRGSPSEAGVVLTLVKSRTIPFTKYAAPLSATITQLPRKRDLPLLSQLLIPLARKAQQGNTSRRCSKRSHEHFHHFQGFIVHLPLD